MLIKPIPRIGEVTRGTQFPVRLKIGPTYEYVDFYLMGGLTLAQMRDITVEINGKPIQTWRDGAQLQALNKYYRRPESDRDDMVRLWFYCPELETLEERRNFALGTADVDTAVITIEIAETAPEGANLEMSARTTFPQKLGVIRKVKQFPQTFAQGGEQDIDKIPARDASIIGMHMQTTAVEKVRLQLDSLEVLRGSVARLHDNYSEVTTAQPGFAHICYSPRAMPQDALSTEGVADFRLSLELSGAATFPLIVEYVDTWSGL